jgi:hypothetical protein
MKLKRPNKLKSADPDSAEEAGKIEPAYGRYPHFCAFVIPNESGLTVHWTFDAAERLAARNEILKFLRDNGESRTVDVAACCQHFRDEPLILVLDFLQTLEREGKVASQLHWFDKSNDKAGQYYTWQLIDDALRERISDDDLQ